MEGDDEDEEMPMASSSDVIGHFPKVEEETPASAPATALSSSQYNMDTDISLLEAPTFTTLDRGPSQPMLNLSWDHTLNLMGKKVKRTMYFFPFASLPTF